MRFFRPDPVPNRGAQNPPDPVPDSGLFRIPVPEPDSGTGLFRIPIFSGYRQNCLVPFRNVNLSQVKCHLTLELKNQESKTRQHLLKKYGSKLES